MYYRFFQKLNYRVDFLGTETFSGRFQGIYVFLIFAVIDEKGKEAYPEHETQLASIRWHLAEGVFTVFPCI